MLLLLVGILLGGCGEPPQQARFINRPKEYMDVASLSPNITEIIGRWGPMNKLAGITSSCNWPQFLKGPHNFPILAGTKPNYEKIAEVKPGLIVYDTDSYNEQDVAKLKELGIDLYPFHANTVDEFIEQLYLLARTIGGETTISEYVDNIYRARSEAQSAVHTPRPKVAILMGDYIAGVRSFYADEIRAAGGEPVGPDADRFVKSNAESLVQMNPDVILAVDDASFKAFDDKGAPETRPQREDVVVIKYIPQSILEDPRLKSTTAVQKRQIASIRPDAILRRGGRVDKVIEGVGRYLAAL